MISALYATVGYNT